MEELKKIRAADQAYKTSNLSSNKRSNILTAIAGAKKSISAAITMNMSIAAFFSRLNRTDKFCPETASATWLLWRRMAIKIPMWFTTGKMTKHIATTRLSIKAWFVGRIKRIKIVSKSQIVPARTAAFTASVDKKISYFLLRKISFPLICLFSRG